MLYKDKNGRNHVAAGTNESQIYLKIWLLLKWQDNKAKNPPNDKYRDYYTRSIGGKDYLKIMIGQPNLTIK